MSESVIRVSEYRKRMRDAGFRKKEFWLPDVTNTEYLESLRRSSAKIREFDATDDTMEWIEAVSVDWNTL
jgi:hypothetical protein